MRQTAGATWKERLPPKLGAVLRRLNQRIRRDRRAWWLGGGAITAAVAVLVWALWPAPAAEPPRARQYIEFTACLLTGERGIADPAAVPVWAGLQDASLATRAKIQYLAITGPQTVENATPFLASLAQAGCNLVFAVGDIPVAAVERGRTDFPAARFFPVGGGRAHTNVSPVSGRSADEIRAAVRDALQQAVAAK